MLLLIDLATKIGGKNVLPVFFTEKCTKLAHIGTEVNRSSGPTCQILISIYKDILSKKNHEHCLYQPIHPTESSYNKELANSNSINNKERYDFWVSCYKRNQKNLVKRVSKEDSRVECSNLDQQRQGC